MPAALYLGTGVQRKKEKKHYHTLIMVNKDAYGWPGDITKRLNNKRGVIFLMVCKAWIRAIYSTDEHYSSVYMPSVYYYLNQNDQESYQEQYKKLIYHVSYMAKMKTKNNEDGERNFGCSQR